MSGPWEQFQTQTAAPPPGPWSKFQSAPSSAVAAPPPGLKPGSREYADWAVSQARAGKKLPQAGPQPPEAKQPTGPLDQISAGFTGAVDSIPFVGDKALAWLEEQKAKVHGTTAQAIAADDKAVEAANPIATTVGKVAGTVLPFMAGGEVPVLSRVLGMDAAAPLWERTLASLSSNAAISGGDVLARGGSAGDAVVAAGTGAAVGAAAPGLGDLIGAGVKAVAKPVSRVIDSVFNPETAASKVVGGAIKQDAKAGGMTAADEASAATNAQPVINADRFGNTTRSLARTAANADPAAKQALSDTVQQRFDTQAGRATDFVKRITGGNIDDLGYLDQVQTAARRSNGANYARAYSAPGAQSVFTPDIAQLFQSPTFRKAVQDATKTASEDAAINGSKAVRNPFVFDANGAPSLRVNPDGSKATPNLQFWDIVQRNLRNQADIAGRGGDKLAASQAGQVRGQLLSVLDGKVPAFKVARQGAAAAFGAEDAVDAGKKFVSQKMGIPEARKAYAQFTPEERKAFGTGFASELIDKIGSVRDRVNVIDQVFGSPAARAQVELALGKNAANELEAFTRVEDIMQMTKNAVQGNSTTAQQLIAAGVVGGIGGGYLGHWSPESIASGAIFTAAGRAGAKYIAKGINQRVMERVAQMLASQDPQVLQRAIRSAQWSPQFTSALNAIERGLALDAQQSLGPPQGFQFPPGVTADRVINAPTGGAPAGAPAP